MHRSPPIQAASVAVLFAALTLLLAYPLSVRPGTTVLADDPDTHLFIWTLAWNTQAFTNDPLSIFDANIYHPERRTLAYSENLIGSALFAAPVIWLGGGPVLALNLVALFTCAMCGIGAYVLGRRAGMGTAGALLCGIIFAFCPTRFFRLPQAHLTAVQWMPFALASLHAYLDGGRRRHLRLAVLFLALQAITTGHGAVFAGLAVTLFVAWRLALGEPLALKRRVRDLGLPGAGLIATTVVVFIPYRIVQVEMGLRRFLADWAATPESFLASPTHLHSFLLSRFAPHVNETASAFLFPGYLSLVLLVIAVWWGRRAPTSSDRRIWRGLAVALNVAIAGSAIIALLATFSGPVRLRTDSVTLLTARSAVRAWTVVLILVAARAALLGRAAFGVGARLRELRAALVTQRYPHSVAAFYLLLTIVCVLLAVGPPLSLWPYVYWLPGFNFIRGPSRFMIPGALGIAVLAGLGFERLTARLAPHARVIAAALIAAALLLEFAAVPLRVVPYHVEIPPADRWLNLQPKPFVVAEAPVMPSERYHTTYMLHSMAHWQKTVHGYSGVRPPLHNRLYDEMRRFPDEQSLRSLSDLGVTYVVVHTDWYPPDEWAEVEARIFEWRSRLVLQHVAGEGRVYLLRQLPDPIVPAR